MEFAVFYTHIDQLLIEKATMTIYSREIRLMVALEVIKEYRNRNY